MSRIDDLEAFVCILEEGGLTAAARRLRRSLQSVSRSLIALEHDLGTTLIQRTTRRSRATEAGLAFYRRVRPALSELNEARLELINRGAEPSGLLRIGAPVQFAPIHLVPIVAAFMDRYPEVTVELKLSDRFVDLTEEGLDLAVRIGSLPDSSLKARRLGELRRVTFGAPAYFAKHGRPAHPGDLEHHQCIVRSFGGESEKWPFRIDGKPRRVSVTGRFRADSTAAIYAAVEQGLGIGFTPLWQIRGLLDRGLAELILVPFETPGIPVHAVWVPGQLMPPTTRLFIDFLAAQLDCERLQNPT